MSSTTDKGRGRMKQAIGALTGDEKLKRSRRRDERAGHIKDQADEAIRVVGDKVEETTEMLSSGEKEW